MAVVLDFELRMTRQSDGTDPEVRIWVDEDGNQQMDNAEEVRPLRRDGLVWRGTRDLAVDSVIGMGLLVRLQAAVGTRYRLRAWSNDGRARHLVYEEQDTTTEGNHRIIGWCRQ